MQQKRDMQTILTAFGRQLLVYALALSIAFPGYLVVESLAAPVAHAQSYAAGYGKYMKGDMAGAEKALGAAVGANVSRAEKAKTYLLLGICQYMLGNNGAAGSSFQQSLALNPKISVQSVDLLVCGGYGHSRMLETVFGGTTDYLLSHATMPIFLAH